MSFWLFFLEVVEFLSIFAGLIFSILLFTLGPLYLFDYARTYDRNWPIVLGVVMWFLLLCFIVAGFAYKG